MASETPDQTLLMKELLDTVKKLQVSQERLASHVDAISGRVNVLAGMKEVRDVATAALAPPEKKEQSESIGESVGESSGQEEVVPPSPSLPATQLGDDYLYHSRKASTSGTSRIILT
jgi:hypothetical protein